MQSFVDFFIGDGAFADYTPFVAIETDDGGGEDALGISGIENQRQAIAELFHDLPGVGAGRIPGKIGAGTGDGAADGRDQLSDYVRTSPAQSDASGIAGDFQRQTMGSFNHESEWPGPEFIGEFEKTIGNFADEGQRLFLRIDQDGQSFGFRAPFGAEYAFDGGKIERINGQAVEGVRGDAYHLAALDEASGVIDDVRFR